MAASNCRTHGVQVSVVTCPTTAPCTVFFSVSRYAQLAVHLDYLVQWAWDWGGCGCPQDWPWGAVGYPRLAKALHDLAQATHPGVVSVASTWDFDKPEAGEFAGLDGWIRTNPGIFSAVVADGHDDFPAWPLQHGGVGGLPVVGFPEISMWGRSPWGGYGANPMPGRFQRFWEEARGLLQGGMPYSEGIYEDLNKVLSAHPPSTTRKNASRPPSESGGRWGGGGGCTGRL